MHHLPSQLTHYLPYLATTATAVPPDTTTYIQAYIVPGLGDYGDRYYGTTTS